jgi:hypothetical protein
MNLRCLFLSLLYGWLPVVGQPQVPVPPMEGHFLTDSIEIGRPFRYSLTYRHTPTTDILFPDTARHFAPYRVQKVAIFATQTTGNGPSAISRDSAVYTLVSFETDSTQLLQVPVRLINPSDCTVVWAQMDTVFLRSKLPALMLADSLAPRSLALATETKLAPLQQQFNYLALVLGFVLAAVVAVLLYWLFGQAVSRQWRLYWLNRRHVFFLSEYNRLSNRIDSYRVAETANEAVVLWKVYLEQLDPQPYMSLTTPELAERMNDERVTNALREADQMIYGGNYTPQSQAALHVLRDVATEKFLECREKIRNEGRQKSVRVVTLVESSIQS